MSVDKEQNQKHVKIQFGLCHAFMSCEMFEDVRKRLRPSALSIFRIPDARAIYLHSESNNYLLWINNGSLTLAMLLQDSSKTLVIFSISVRTQGAVHCMVHHQRQHTGQLSLDPLTNNDGRPRDAVLNLEGLHLKHHQTVQSHMCLPWIQGHTEFQSPRCHDCLRTRVEWK